MRTINNWRRGLVTLFALFALALTGCAGAAPQELPTLTKQVQIEKLDCAASKNALARLDAVEKSSATDAEKNAFKNESGVNPSDKKAVKKLREQLKDRRTVACEADRQFTVPANEEDVNASAFNALVNRCGAAFDRSSVVAPAKGDKASYLLKGKGLAVDSWREYQCTMMRNPTVTDAWGQALSALKTPSGSTGKELNADWLPAALDKGKASLAEAWLEKRGDGKLYVTPDFQRFAFKIVTILNRLEKKKGEGTAKWSYALETFKGDGIPRAFRTKKGYWGEFILLKYTPKGWSCASVVLGINVKDGRPAGLKTFCSSSGKPTGTPPGTPPGKHKPVCKDGKCKPVRCKHGVCPKTGSNPGLTTHGERKTVNNNDGATDSKGIQHNPQADADAAKKAAEAEAAKKQAEADKAAEEAATDSGSGDGDHGGSGGTPGTGW